MLSNRQVIVKDYAVNCPTTSGNRGMAGMPRMPRCAPQYDLDLQGAFNNSAPGARNVNCFRVMSHIAVGGIENTHHDSYV